MNPLFSGTGLILLMVFATTVVVVMGAGAWLFALNSPLQRRLAEIADPEHLARRDEHPEGSFQVRWVDPVAKVIMPTEDWKLSQLRTRLVRAGLRQRRALPIYLACKVALALAMPLLLALPLFMLGFLGKSPSLGMMLVCLCGLVGFFAPNAWLAHRTEERQLAIANDFPDALDMLVVCVEAGLSLDAAIQRVGREFLLTHPELSEEMQLVSLEMRAGRSRDEALRSLAERTGVADIGALVSILIQTEHFGTSIADSLREQAADMRLLRVQRARERAAKLPVKLVFPIMAFIFPALFLIILGPAAIRIYTAIIQRGGQ